MSWLEFWAKITPELIEAAQALHARFADDTSGAIAEIRKIKDHWGKADAENADFRARIQAVADEQPQVEPEREIAEPPLDGGELDDDEPKHA